MQKNKELYHLTKQVTLVRNTCSPDIIFIYSHYRETKLLTEQSYELHQMLWQNNHVNTITY